MIPQKDFDQPVNPGELSCNDYNVFMSAILDRVTSISDESSIKQANELIDYMYNAKGFESHKQSFIDEVGRFTSSIRTSMIEIINDNKDVKIIKTILLEIPSDKIKIMAAYDEQAANYLLQNKLFNLENLKHLMTIINEKTGNTDNRTINKEFIINLPGIIKSMENN